MTKSVISEMFVVGGWGCGGENQKCSEAELGMVECGAYSTKEERKGPRSLKESLCKE